MTLERIKAVFAALPNCAAWSLQLLKINTSKQNRTSYTGREIALSPEGSKGMLNSYRDITEYNGSTMDRVICRLNKTNELIATVVCL